MGEVGLEWWVVAVAVVVAVERLASADFTVDSDFVLVTMCEFVGAE